METRVVVVILLLLSAQINAELTAFNLSRTRRQAGPRDGSQWESGINLPISEEAVNAGGYATPQCEPITVPICNGAFYEYTRMPNILNHESQEEAGLEVGVYQTAFKGVFKQ